MVLVSFQQWLCCSYLVSKSSYSPLPFSPAAAAAEISNWIREDSHLYFWCPPNLVSNPAFVCHVVFVQERSTVYTFIQLKHFLSQFLAVSIRFPSQDCCFLLGSISWTNHEPAPTWGSHVEVHCQDAVSCDDLSSWYAGNGSFLGETKWEYEEIEVRMSIIVIDE